MLLRFPGQWEDGVGGFYQNWWREYGAGFGRYMTRDPQVFEIGAFYSRNNSMRNFDYNGLMCYSVRITRVVTAQVVFLEKHGACPSDAQIKRKMTDPKKSYEDGGLVGRQENRSCPASQTCYKARDVDEERDVDEIRTVWLYWNLNPFRGGLGAEVSDDQLRGDAREHSYYNECKIRIKLIGRLGLKGWEGTCGEKLSCL
jgi:hypothetical protein